MRSPTASCFPKSRAKAQRGLCVEYACGRSARMHAKGKIEVRGCHCLPVHYTHIRLGAGREWFWQDTSAIGAPQRPHSPRAMAVGSVPLSCLSLVARASMHALERTRVSRQARRVESFPRDASKAFSRDASRPHRHSSASDTVDTAPHTPLLVLPSAHYTNTHGVHTHSWRTDSTQISTQEAAGETEQQLAASLRALGVHPLIMSSALSSLPSWPLAGPMA
jgi:hypothetical protein